MRPARPPPGLLVAELLGDHLAQFQAQPIGYALGQVLVRAAAEQHDVGHGEARRGAGALRGARQAQQQRRRERESAAPAGRSRAWRSRTEGGATRRRGRGGAAGKRGGGGRAPEGGTAELPGAERRGERRGKVGAAGRGAERQGRGCGGGWELIALRWMMPWELGRRGRGREHAWLWVVLELGGALGPCKSSCTTTPPIPDLDLSGYFLGQGQCGHSRRERGKW